MRADPVTEFVPDEELTGFLSDVAEVIEDVASKMPDHGEFVRGLPTSSPPPSQAESSVPLPVAFALRYERAG